MRKKLYMAMYLMGITIVLVFFNMIVTFVMSTPAIPLTQAEIADTSIGQYTERLNSPATTSNDVKKPVRISQILSQGQGEQLADGCSLRLAFTPMKKTLNAGDVNSRVATLSNRGKEVCKNVSLSVYYTDNEKFLSSDPRPSASDYYWAVGDLPSLKVYSINLTTEITSHSEENMISEACAAADNSPDACSQSVIFIQDNTAPAQTQALATNKTEVPSSSSSAGGVWGGAFSGKEFGIWVWDSPTSITPAYAKEIISTSKKNGFNTIYLSIDDYLDVSTIEDSQKRSEEKGKYMKSLSDFIASSKSSGIEVDAVGGGKDWAMQQNRWKGFTLIDFVTEYNKEYPNAKVRNLQYDVEPYLLPGYAADKEGTLKEYVEFIDESVNRMTSSSFGFSIVIPHFYDSVQKWTPSFDYNGESGYTFTHLLKILNRKKNTEIIVMAYRNFFEEDNGIKQISEKEVREATDGGYGVKIIIAQETGSVSPEYVTYHNHSKSELFDSLSKIQDYFGGDRDFGGIAIHYFDSFLKLK